MTEGDLREWIAHLQYQLVETSAEARFLRRMTRGMAAVLEETKRPGPLSAQTRQARERYLSAVRLRGFLDVSE